jgi:hypothetical protein
MSDYTDRYKKAMALAVDKWGKHSVECGRELAPINKDIEKLEKNKKPSPDEAKKLAAVCDKVHQASAALRLDLLSIPLPPKDSLESVRAGTSPALPEKDLIELPDWISKVVKEKGIQLGDGLTTVPDAKR